MNRPHFPRTVVTLVAIPLAISCIVVGTAAAAPDQFLRIAVSPKAAVYAQFSEGHLRVAPTVAGLAKAKAIAPAGESRYRIYQYRDVTLPVPASALEKGLSGVKARFDSSGTRAAVEIGLVRKDARGTQWTYWTSAGQLATASTAAKAPVVKMPQLAALRLDVRAVPNGRRLGVGVTVQSGNQPVSDITRQGRTADALRVTIRDDRGKVVASKTGSLAAFGFA